ncbi:MAG: division plane positioning ATPase MipZ [Rhodospirillales bacterium]
MNDMTQPFTPTASQKPDPHVIVVGNEKGGSGKSTTCMHVMVALMKRGLKVGAIDLDARQGTLSRYYANRRDFMADKGLRLPMPLFKAVKPSDDMDREAAEADELQRLQDAVLELAAEADVILMDTPGNDTHLTRLAHSFADTLITPLNDSFIDLDVLADVDPKTVKIRKPSRYAELIWAEKMRRAKRDGGSMDWIILRNRLSHLDAHNKRAMERLIEEFAKRFGARVVPGFGERVIYRELFLKGLTLLDLRDVRQDGGGLNLSQVAARQEVRALVDAIRLPEHLAR